MILSAKKIHPHLNRPQFYAGIFRMVFTVPALASVVGMVWGWFMFPSIEGMPAFWWVGGIVGIAIGAMAGQAMGWMIWFAKTGEFIITTFFLTSIPFIYMTLPADFRNFHPAFTPISVVLWILIVWYVGRLWKPDQPASESGKEEADSEERADPNSFT